MREFNKGKQQRNTVISKGRSEEGKADTVKGRKRERWEVKEDGNRAYEPVWNNKRDQ